MNNNPFKNTSLTPEEKQILQAAETNPLQEVKDVSILKKLYKQYAKNTLNKLKNINIRLSSRDIEILKSKANESGMPYQTLVSSILHQYSNDKFKITLP